MSPWLTANSSIFPVASREPGADDVAAVFEETARQETTHAFCPLELLYPPQSLRVEKMLEMAAKRFAALVNVEERHANRYRDALNNATS